MNRVIRITNLFILLNITLIKSIAQVEMNFSFNIPYGENQIAGKYVTIKGVKIYYEEYGSGEPLLLIHGNGGSILEMGNQIDFFKTKYRVFVADSRGHGNSELKTDSLTYRQIARDWIGLVNKLELDSVYIFGWSDGGNVALLMGGSNSVKIKKIAIMGANLRPDTTAVKIWAYNDVNKELDQVNEMIRNGDTSSRRDFTKQRLGLLHYQPNINWSELQDIKCPVLVMSGDMDIIKLEHTVEIFKSIPLAQLCIMQGETHFAPASNPKKFNKIVNDFISEPFKRPDSNWTTMDKSKFFVIN